MTKIKDIRERELISIITNALTSDPQDSLGLLTGPGADDCAVLDLGYPQLLVATTDMVHTRADFPPGMTPWQMGWMSVAVTLSDIAAMGARPTGIMAALGLPPGLELEFVTELVEGMNACARQNSTAIIGGDVDRHDELTIVGSAMGLVAPRHLALRKGAKVGDLVCVTGELGTAGAALDAILGSTYAPPAVAKKFCEPVPRISEGMALARSGCLGSMMDISDGLALSLHDMAGASSVGFHIDADAIPVMEQVRSMASGENKLLLWSLYAGGDFELLFTLRPGCLEEAAKTARFTVIGTVTEKNIMLERNGQMEVIEGRGFQQFGDKL